MSQSTRPMQPSAMPCPLCAGASSRAFVVHDIGVLDCAACGHRFAEVVPGQNHAQTVYSDDYFHGGGAGYTDYLAEAELLRAHGRRYGELVARHAAPGRMLDVGAAAGYVLKGYQDAGWQGRGLEPNAAMAEHARQVLDLDVTCGTAESLQDDEQFDLVSMVQVIAHFTDPNGALGRLARATRPGGLWLIETWDFRSWTARLTGRHWHEYSPPSVLHWYSRDTLAALAARHGFEPVAQGRPSKRLLGAHAKSLLRYKFGGGALRPWLDMGLRALPDSAELRYPAEDLFWMLLRKRGRAEP